jgi:hypothetical protein
VLAAAAAVLTAVGTGVVAFLTTPAAPKPARALVIRLAVAAAGLAVGVTAVFGTGAPAASLGGTESGNGTVGTRRNMSRNAFVMRIVFAFNESYSVGSKKLSNWL